MKAKLSKTDYDILVREIHNAPNEGAVFVEAELDDYLVSIYLSGYEIESLTITDKNGHSYDEEFIKEKLQRKL